MPKSSRSAAPLDYMTPREVCSTARIVLRTLRRWVKDKTLTLAERLRVLLDLVERLQRPTADNLTSSAERKAVQDVA
jgi:hypothetical protein